MRRYCQMKMKAKANFDHQGCGKSHCPISISRQNQSLANGLETLQSQIQTKYTRRKLSTLFSYCLLCLPEKVLPFMSQIKRQRRSLLCRYRHLSATLDKQVGRAYHFLTLFRYLNVTSALLPLPTIFTDLLTQVVACGKYYGVLCILTH